MCIHVVASDRTVSILWQNGVAIVYRYYILKMHSSIDEYLGWFCILAVVSNAGLKVDIQVGHWHIAFLSCGYISSRVVGGSYGNVIFNILRNLPLFSTVLC